MYQIWKNALHLDTIFSEVDKKIDELEQQVALEIEKNKAEEDREFQKVLERLSLFFLPVTILTGILGMNIIEVSNESIWPINSYRLTWTIILTIIVCLFIFFAIQFIVKNKVKLSSSNLFKIISEKFAKIKIYPKD